MQAEFCGSMEAEEMEDFGKPLVEELAPDLRGLLPVSQFLAKLEAYLLQYLSNPPPKITYDSIIRPLMKKYSINVTKTDLVQVYLDLVHRGQIQRNETVKRILTRKLRRATCGILNVTVFTHPGNMGPRWNVQISRIPGTETFSVQMTGQAGPYNFLNYVEYTKGLSEAVYSSPSWEVAQLQERKFLLVPAKDYNPKRVIFDVEMGLFNLESIESVQSGVLLGKEALKSCPYRCSFCPTQKTQDDNELNPKSYLQGESGVDRALENNYDTVKQIYSRLRTLEKMGHEPTKCVVRTAGGTWDVYTANYQTTFARDVFYAFNTYHNPYSRARLSLEEELYINESAEVRVVEFSIETRPDLITVQALSRYRSFGVTAVEIGIQHTDDRILALNKRDATIGDTRRAIRLLRHWGFKVCGHIMPDLLGSSFEMDMDMIVQMFEDTDLFVDRFKLYPTMVLEHSELKEIYLRGDYKPYFESEPEKFLEMMEYFLMNAKPWQRIERVIRDMPASTTEGRMNVVVGGVNITNMNQVLINRLAERNQFPVELRSREPGARTLNSREAVLVVRSYEAADGVEYFLSFETPDAKFVHGFLKLRFNNNPHDDCLPEELKGRAIIVWLQVYGVSVPIGEHRAVDSQHVGFGQRLLAEAEKICIERGVFGLADISGIGVREYYRTYAGYSLEGTYMVKELKPKRESYEETNAVLHELHEERVNRTGHHSVNSRLLESKWILPALAFVVVGALYIAKRRFAS